MSNRKTEFGYTYRDAITGFQGVCTGKSSFITGCAQSLLAPPVDDDNPRKLNDAHWYDDDRLVLVDDIPRMELPTAALSEPEPVNAPMKGGDKLPDTRAY